MIPIAAACSTITLNQEVSEPRPELHDLYGEYHEQYARLCSAARPIMHRLTGLADHLT